MFKHPIYSFSIIVLIFGILVLSLIGFWGIGTLIWLWGVYLILIFISFLLKINKTKHRKTIEWILIAVYVLFHSLYCIHWSVGTKVYFPNQHQPFVGNNQNFIIVFDIEGELKLPDNFFTDNKIYIPQNGIILTSSSTSDYKQSYTYLNREIMERFVASSFVTYNCFGKENFKFEYLMGSVNEKGILDYVYRDSIVSIICDLFKEHKIKNNLDKGYEDGKSYLEQTQIYINHQNLTRLPKGLLELKNLDCLNIHSNSLKEIPDDVFMFPKLKNLTIGFNGIDSIPTRINEIKTLEYLAINGNNLKDLPDELLELPKLRKLYIRENKFDSLKLKEIVKKYQSKGIEIQYE